MEGVLDVALGNLHKIVPKVVKHTGQSQCHNGMNEGLLALEDYGHCWVQSSRNWGQKGGEGGNHIQRSRSNQTSELSFENHTHWIHWRGVQSCISGQCFILPPWILMSVADVSWLLNIRKLYLFIINYNNNQHNDFWFCSVKGQGLDSLHFLEWWQEWPDGECPSYAWRSSALTKLPTTSNVSRC